LAGGLLGFVTDDLRMRQALEIAKQQDLEIEFVEDTAATEHANTIRIIAEIADKKVELVGISIGGRKIEIIELNGFQSRLSGKHEINIGHMEVNRKDLGQEAMMVIETDQNIQDNVMQELENADHINHVSTIVS